MQNDASQYEAVELSGTGGLDVLTLVRGPVPTPGPGEVLIEVVAAGLNRGDIKQRIGDFPMPPNAPSVLGLEVSGRVAQLGDGVDGLSVGQEVCALLLGGGYATHCVAPAAQCLPIPKGCDLVEAAGIPEVFSTVWMALFRQASLKAGQTLLVHGGSSGIGTAAIQLAKSRDCTVIVTAGSPEKLDFCRSLGADLAIDYKTEDFVDRVLAHTSGKGVDVVLDMVGGDYIERNLDCLAMHGTVCSVAGDSEPTATYTIRKVMLKRATITGCTLRHRTVAEKQAILGDLFAHAWPRFEDGGIRPIIGATFPLGDVKGAHAALEAGKVIGKVLLVTGR